MRVRKVEINGVTAYVSERRPRFFSEGAELRNGEERDADEEPPAAMGPPLQRRDRSRSEPAIQREVHRMFGQELRRISDEFHQSYETLVSPCTDSYKAVSQASSANLSCVVRQTVLRLLCCS